MATFVGLNNRVYVGAYDLSGLANQVDFGPITRNMVRCTTFNDGGFDCYTPGLISGEARVSGNQDITNLDANISTPGSIGSQFVVTVAPNTTGTVSVADPCYTARGVLRSVNPLTGPVGEMAGFDFGFTFDSASPRSFVAHPSAARISTGTGTAVALTGPTASQYLYASIHVLAYTGFTSVVFKVQSDDSGGFGSGTDRITFTSVTAVGSEFKSVAGNFSSETHHRVTWTCNGSGSVTFVAFFGVI